MLHPFVIAICELALNGIGSLRLEGNCNFLNYGHEKW
jgi:hypothetical protein